MEEGGTKGSTVTLLLYLDINVALVLPEKCPCIVKWKQINKKEKENNKKEEQRHTKEIRMGKRL